MNKRMQAVRRELVWLKDRPLLLVMLLAVGYLLAALAVLPLLGIH